MRTRKLGFMPNLFAMMAHSPGALRAVAGVGEHVRFNGAIDPDLGEAVICHVAQTFGNRYEWSHHIHRVPELLRTRVGTPAAETEPAPTGPAIRKPTVGRSGGFVQLALSIPADMCQDIPSRCRNYLLDRKLLRNNPPPD